MSAWIVAKGHIDCIVQTAITEGLATFARILARLGFVDENAIPHNHPGWSGGPWGIEEITEAVAAVPARG